MTVTEQIDKARQRSPSVPVIPLQQAISYVEKIYAKDGRSPTPRAVAAQHMGYSGLSGASLPVLAALKHYGLTEESGQGTLRITKLGLGLLHPSDDLERTELLHQALNKPKIFQSILGKYDDQLPSDATIKSYLIRTHDFKEASADTLIRSLRLSLEFAGGSRTPQAPDADEADDDDDGSDDRANTIRSANRRDTATESIPEATSNLHRIDAPLTSRTRVELLVHGPIGAEEVDRLRMWLEKVVLPWADFSVFRAEE